MRAEFHVTGGDVTAETWANASESSVESYTMAANDVWAAHLLKALHGRAIHVPADLSIIGFDDIELAAITIPGLTTMRIPLKEVACEASRGLVNIIQHKQDQPLNKLLETTLTVRESTAPPRH